MKLHLARFCVFFAVWLLTSEALLPGIAWWRRSAVMLLWMLYADLSTMLRARRSRTL